MEAGPVVSSMWGWPEPEHDPKELFERWQQAWSGCSKEPPGQKSSMFGVEWPQVGGFAPHLSGAGAVLGSCLGWVGGSGGGQAGSCADCALPEALARSKIDMVVIRRLRAKDFEYAREP